jgi:parvulin-like peptidyl-prolyl isomerase
VKKYALVITALAAIGVVTVTGCNRGGNAAKSDNVAVINGQKISRKEFIDYMQSQAGRQSLAAILYGNMILQLAKEKGVSPTDQQVEQRLSLLKKTADLEFILDQSGASMDSVKSQARVVQAEVNLAIKQLGSKVTDDQVKQVYEAGKASKYELPEQVRVDTVAFRTEQAAKDAAKKLKGGATLEQIASEPSMDHGQIVTDLVRKSGPGVDPAVVKASFDTSKGKTSDPVKQKDSKSGIDYWVIARPGDRVPAITISFDEAKDVIRGDIARQFAQDDPQYMKDLSEARSKAKVEILDSSLKSASKLFKGI